MPKTLSENGPTVEWAIQDEIEEALIDFFGDAVPFTVDVRESDSRYKAHVTVSSPPTSPLAIVANQIEMRLASEGWPVVIEFEQGDIPAVARPHYDQAKAAFDSIWKKLESATTPYEQINTAARPPVRDFIYLDVERLASLFAQSKRGLTTLVALAEKGAQSAKTSETDMTTAAFDLERFRGEMSVLHDYMYHLVEKELGKSILHVTPELISTSNGISELRGSRLCKVSGNASMHDYRRLTTILEKFNQLGEAIAYSILNSPEITKTVDALKVRREQIAGKTRQKVHEQIGVLTNVKEYAKANGLHQDEQLLKNLKLFADLFYADTYEVQIHPANDQQSHLYRSLLRKDFLRIPPERLRLLYGSPTQDQWTLVGSVTCVSGVSSPEGDSSPDASGGAQENPASSGSTPMNMRRAYNQLFKAMNLLENMVVESVKSTEIIIFPLAIYRDLRS
jgi:hypothetical protein